MKFKRILAALLAVTVVGANIPVVSVNFPKISMTANAEETESYLKYETLDDGTIEITRCDKTITKAEIPAEIDGKKVTSIGDYAFYGCSRLTSITILNPNCEIDVNSTISNGYENSTAQAYAEKNDYKFESLDDAPATKVIAGDANCDGKVSIADATAILQHLGNQDKYGLSAEGLKNADVDENDGVSINDALVIQKVDAKLLTAEQLPL